MSRFAHEMYIAFGNALHDLFDLYVLSEVADMGVFVLIHSITILRHIFWRGLLLLAVIVVCGNLLIALKLGTEHRRRWLAWRMGKYGVPDPQGVVLVH